MKYGLRLLGVICAAFVAFTIYWEHQLDMKTKALTETARPFMAACVSPSGCLLSPPGWRPNGPAYRTGAPGEWIKTSDTASYEGQLEYVANRSDFELRWHVATDVYLVARGGAGSALRVTRFMD